MAQKDSRKQSNSISWRLQRVTEESAFVSVPVTEDLMVEQPDGSLRLNVPKMAERAVELGKSSDVNWQVENQKIEPHPLQKPPEPAKGSTEVPAE